MKCHIKVEKPPMEDIAAIQSLLFHFMWSYKFSNY